MHFETFKDTYWIEQSLIIPKINSTRDVLSLRAFYSSKKALNDACFLCPATWTMRHTLSASKSTQRWTYIISLINCGEHLINIFACLWLVGYFFLNFSIFIFAIWWLFFNLQLVFGLINSVILLYFAE